MDLIRRLERFTYGLVLVCVSGLLIAAIVGVGMLIFGMLPKF